MNIHTNIKLVYGIDYTTGVYAEMTSYGFYPDSVSRFIPIQTKFRQMMCLKF